MRDLDAVRRLLYEAQQHKPCGCYPSTADSQPHCVKCGEGREDVSWPCAEVGALFPALAVAVAEIVAWVDVADAWERKVWRGLGHGHLSENARGVVSTTVLRNVLLPLHSLAPEVPQ